MEKDLYKIKHLQEPISMLTEENLELLEKHCIKNRKQDIGQRFREHEIVFESIQAYKEQQVELEKKEKIIDSLAEYIIKQISIEYNECDFGDMIKGECGDKFEDCVNCIKRYFERKVEDVK